MYQVVTERSYDKAMNQANQRKIIFLSESQIQGDHEFITLLNKKKWTRFDERLKSVTDINNSTFLQSIRLLIAERYPESFQALNRLPEDAFDCQVLVLKTDCLYELKADSVDFKSRYQKALDCTQDPKIKSIIKTRYRFVKYGY